MPHSPLFRVFVRALQQARRNNLAAAGEAMPIPEPKPGWSRRRFLRAAAILAASGGTGLALPRPPALAGWAAGGAPRIAVVGGGLAGLNAAYHLKQQGFLASVYEARSRLGGRVVSTSSAVEPGQIIDIGGSFINSDHEDMLEIAERFGLPLFNRSEDAASQPFPAVAYFFDGRLLPEAELADALGPLADQIAFDAKLLDQDFESFAPFFDEQSVSRYLDLNAKKIPKTFVRELIETAIRSEYGVETKDSSALQLLFALPTVDGQSVEVVSTSNEAFVVQDGAGALIDGFSAALDGQIHLGRRLARVEAVGNGYQLTFEGMGGESEDDEDDSEDIVVNADFVVLALPFTTLRKVKLELPLPKELEKFIGTAGLGKNDKLIAGLSERVWRNREVFSTELASDKEFSYVWEETQRQPELRGGALTFYTGGSEANAVAGKGAKRIGKKFISRLDEAIPGLSAAATGSYFLSQWTKDPYANGSYASYRAGELTRFAPYFWIEGDTPEDRQEVAVGNLLLAGEHLSDAFNGFMNGAAQTGRLAAEAIIRQVA